MTSSRPVTGPRTATAARSCALRWLAAARNCGLRTAFVPRPAEHGPNQTTDLRPDQEWDVVAADFPFLGACYGVGALGAQLGAGLDRVHSEPVGPTCPETA